MVCNLTMLQKYWVTWTFDPVVIHSANRIMPRSRCAPGHVSRDTAVSVVLEAGRVGY